MSIFDNENLKEWFNEDVDFELEKFNDYDDSLVESPIVKLSDDDLYNPSDISLKRIAADAAEKERLAKEAEEKARRKEELSGKYSDVIYKIVSVTESHPEGLELGRLEEAFGELVPNQGEADTVAGELVRAAMRICYRYFNDGDYFFMGYGLETAGPSAAYLTDMGYDDIIYGATKIAEDYYPGFDNDKFEDAYEKFLKELAMKITDDIIEDIELLEEPNDKDSRFYNDDKTSDTYAMLVEEQPRFDYDFMVSDKVRELMDADIIRDRDIVDYVENYIDYNSAFEGSEVYMSSDYIVVEHLTIEGYEALEDVIKNHGDKFWEDFENEHEDEYNELYAEDEEDDDDDEYEDDVEDFEESMNNKFNSIRTNTKNDIPVDESLYNKIIANDLEYNPEIDSLTAEEDGITIDIQDRESHEHSKRGSRRWASPKVKTSSWGRIWKDDECKQYHGSKYEVRSQMAKDLKDINEDFNYSSNSYKLETADDILSTLIDNVPDNQIDTIVATTERIAHKLATPKMSDLYVLTISDEYSPDWANATKEGVTRVFGNTIQYWTLDSIFFAEVRAAGQSMLFFKSEDDAKTYVNNVDAENMMENLTEANSQQDKVVEVDPYEGFENGDRFEFAENLVYGDVDALIYDSPYEALPRREAIKKLRAQGFIISADDGNGNDIAIIPNGMIGECVSPSWGNGADIKVGDLTLNFAGEPFSVKFLSDKHKVYDPEEVRRSVESYLESYPYSADSDIDDVCEEICDNVFDEDYHDCHYSLGETVYHTVEDYLDNLDESCSKKAVKEGYHSNSEEYKPFFPEDYTFRDEQTANFFIQTTIVSHNGKQVGTIQKHPKRGGERKNDSNRVANTYYIAIKSNGEQTMVDTPKEVADFIMSSNTTIKESSYNETKLKDFQNKFRHK